MADRIAVLNNGRLEQLDVPEAIYHTPATPFVADFVGQADFIPGLVEQNAVLTELGIFPNEDEYRMDAKVVVMIRPDDVHIIPSDEAKATILARQFRGSENLYTIALPSGRIVHSSASSTSVYSVGTPVELSVIATHTVLFPQNETLARP
jgi:iron(III) transport system ATP-binding protein